MPASSRTRESPFPPVATSPETLLPATARILVGGVGYRNLRDLSAGPFVIERLGASLGDRVDVEDLSYGPIDVLFALQRRAPYAVAIFVTAVARGQVPGTVTRRVWDFPVLAPDQLQERVAEAVTGVISLDNLLYICGHFKALPDRVVVIEVEPVDEDWGEALSAVGQVAVAAAARIIHDEIAGLLAA